MKYYIIAGEASGDLHGSNLIKHLQKIDTSSDFRCWGGDKMKSYGVTLVKHYKELAFMGFIEVILNLRTILNNITFAKKDILSYRPDLVIFIDYPGFNLRLAAFCKKNNIPVYYYISPQIWAWKESRIKTIKKNIDHLYVILPFEKKYYEKKHHFKVDFVGHPLLTVIKEYQKNNDQKAFLTKYKLGKKPIIALLPGSRKQEISKILNSMISVVHDFNQFQFVIACTPHQPEQFYRKILSKHHQNILLLKDETYNLLNVSHAAIVTSGTATLETALFNVPQIVCYKTSFISYIIAKWLIKLKYISLVNLISNKKIVPELIQNKCNAKNIKKELLKIMNDSLNRQKIILF